MNEQSINLDVNASFQGSAANNSSRMGSAKKRSSPKKGMKFEAIPSPGKPSRMGPSARHTAQALRHAQSFDERQALLRQNSKITDEDIAEYKKTEIIRKSIADVKKRAAEQNMIRQSPEKVYAHVKSRIAGNMKSQKKAKKTAKKIQNSIQEQ